MRKRDSTRCTRHHDLLYFCKQLFTIYNTRHNTQHNFFFLRNTITALHPRSCSVLRKGIYIRRHRRENSPLLGLLTLLRQKITAQQPTSAVVACLMLFQIHSVSSPPHPSAPIPFLPDILAPTPKLNSTQVLECGTSPLTPTAQPTPLLPPSTSPPPAFRHDHRTEA